MKKTDSARRIKRIRSMLSLLLTTVLLLGMLPGVISAEGMDGAPVSAAEDEMPDVPNTNQSDEEETVSAQETPVNEAVEMPDVPEREAVTYAPQPENRADVQAAIDAYTQEYRAVLTSSGFSAALAVQKPHWQHAVESSLMPDGYNCRIVTDDADFGADYYTFFVSIAVMANIPFSGTSSATLQTAINSAADGDVIIIANGVIFTGAVTIPAGKSITIRSQSTTRTLTQTNSSERHFIVESTADLTLRDIVLDGGGIAGGVRVNGGALNMESGAVIKNCAATDNYTGITTGNEGGTVTPFNGGGVFVLDGGTLNMSGDSTVSSCTAYHGGGVLLGNSSTLKMSGSSKITENKATVAGGGVYATVSSVITMHESAAVENNETYADAAKGNGGYGGGIYLDTSSLTMDDSSVLGSNTADSYSTGSTSPAQHFGGGVAALRGSTVILKGKAGVYENTAMSGGGIYVSRSVFTMSEEAHINDNILGSVGSGNGGGGGIYSSGSNIIMEGGSIYGHTAVSGGGVYLCNLALSATREYYPASFTMSGGEIYGNTSTGTSFLFGGGGVALCNVGNEEADDTNSIVTMTMSGSAVVRDNKSIYGGGVWLFGRTSLCYAKLTMQDNAKITGNTSGDGGGVYLSYRAYSYLDMTGGGISGNGATGNGGGVYMYAGADGVETVTMGGGEISGNGAAGNGGGVYMFRGGIIAMSGGKISGNGKSVSIGGTVYGSTQAGGGVYMNAYGAVSAYLKMSGASAAISANAAANNGGGVYMNGVSNAAAVFLQIADGTVYDNTTTNYGGGVYMANQYTNVDMTGGSFDTNTASVGGGAYMAGGAFTMSDGAIIGNTATVGDGGGVYVAATGDNALTVTDGTVTDNTAALDGGGIYTVKAAGVSGYSNLNVGTDVTFSGNASRQYYTPPGEDTVNAHSLWMTITNYTGSAGSGNSPVSRVEPVNNHDINVVTYAVTFYIDTVQVSDPAPQTVAQYCRASDPNKSGVNGWYKTSDTSDSTNKWSFTADLVVQNTSLYAETVIVAEWDLGIRKVDAAASGSDSYMSNPQYLLESAEFELYELVCTDTGHTSAGQHTDDSCWSAAPVDTGISDQDGLLVFSGLQSGTYLIVETKAPAGYQLPNGKWIIKVDAESETITLAGTVGTPAALAEVTDPSDVDAAILVTNIKQYQMPQMGGKGTQLFMILGSLILAAGVYVFYFTRRKKGYMPMH